MATVLLVGGALAVGGAAVAAAGGSALAYRQHKKHKKHKEKKQLENAAKQQFGMHLEDLDALSADGIPVVIRACMDHINNCLELEDMQVFVEAGDPIRFGELKGLLDENPRNPPNLEGELPLNVGEVLKSFLLSLPEPLCTFSLYEEFAVAQQAQDSEDWMNQMRGLLMQLPEINTRVIVHLTRFFAALCMRSNVLEPKDIAKVFATCYADPLEPVDPKELFAEGLVERMVVNHCSLFEGIDVYYFCQEDEIVEEPVSKKRRGSRIKNPFSSKK